MINFLKFQFVFLIVLSLFSCKKENNPVQNNDYLNTPDFIQNCYNDSLYVVSAIKEVSGIGSTLWKCNGTVIRSKVSEKVGIFYDTYSCKFYELYNVIAAREHMSFTNFLIKIGDYSSKLSNFDDAKKDPSLIGVDFYRLADDGDVFAGVWTLDKHQKNIFKITSVNYIDSTFTGTFDFHFVDDFFGNSVAPYSSKINFLDGKFTLPIPK